MEVVADNMKRFLTTGFILLALLVGGVSVVHADPAGSGNGSACDLTPGSGLGDGVISNGTCVTPAQYTSASDPAQASPVRNGSNGTEQVNSTLATVMTWIMTLFAWLVGIAAITLDTAVYYTVVTMGNYISHLSAIGVTWRILRDFANIMFIFGFIGAGIATILNVDQYGWKTKMIPMLLVGAVFLNFSLFFTEALVDVSNLFATQFYQQINGGTPAGQKLPGSYSDLPSAAVNEGISSKIMNQIGLQTIYARALGNGGGVVFTSTNTILIGFLGIILFLITAFVMFALAFILVARFVALIFFMLLSPVGFMGLAIPQMQYRAGQWWSNFLEQIVTAPVLMLLLYVALAVITDANFLTFGSGGRPDWTGLITSGTASVSNVAGFAGMVLSFLVAMGLLLVVVIKAKNMSAFGAGKAIELAGKATFGATAWAGNRTIGRGAYRLQRVARQSATFNKFDALTGRLATRGLDRLATGSFDVRGATIGGGLKGLHIDAGEVAKDGFVGARKRNIEDHEKAVKAIGTAHSEAVYTINTEDQKIIEASKKAGDEKKKAEEVRDKAAEEKKKADAELTEIDAQMKKDRYWKDSNPGKLEAAQEKVRLATENLATVTTKFTEAETAAKDAAKAAAEKAPGKRKSESLKASKEAYAEGLESNLNWLNPITFAAYGPNSGDAARKIRESMHEKSDKDKVVDLLAKIGKPAEAAGGGEQKPGGAAPKPPADDHH